MGGRGHLDSSGGLFTVWENPVKLLSFEDQKEQYITKYIVNVMESEEL